MDRDPIVSPNVMVIKLPEDSDKEFFVPFGTKLYLSFTTGGVYNDTDVDNDEFLPPLPDRTHFEANDLWGPSLPNPDDHDGDSIYFYFTPDYREADIVGTLDKPAITTTGGGVIHPGSGFKDLFAELEEGKASEENHEFKEILCECWPCTRRFINFLLGLKSVPIPGSARAFLKLLISSGDKAYNKICKKE